jgi:hypothetical protein
MLVALTRTFQLCIGMLARVDARTRVKSRRVASLAHTWTALLGLPQLIVAVKALA